MVWDKFKNPLNLSEHWKPKTNFKIHDKIHGLRQIWKPYLDLKGFKICFGPWNLYWIFAIDLALAMVQDNFVSDF